MIDTIFENTLENLSEYSSSQNKEFTQKAKEVSENIHRLDTSEISDSLIAKALEIVELNEELQGVMK